VFHSFAYLLCDEKPAFISVISHLFAIQPVPKPGTGAVHDDARTSGRKVGMLQAANIAGCVAGTLVVGLGALGWWGTTGTLRALMAAGLVFVAMMARRRPLAGDTVALGVALAALAVVLPSQAGLWLRLHGDAGGEAMVEEDATGMAAMIPSGGRFSLWVNGRTNSSLPFGGFHTLLGAGGRTDARAVGLASVVVVKRGAAGVTVLVREAGAGVPARFDVATRAIPAADTTGAGDAFDAGFIAEWLASRAAGRSPSQALRRAAVAANRVAARHLATPRRELPLG
jgi:hypothetical protein